MSTGTVLWGGTWATERYPLPPWRELFQRFIRCFLSLHKMLWDQTNGRRMTRWERQLTVLFGHQLWTSGLSPLPKTHPDTQTPYNMGANPRLFLCPSSLFWSKLLCDCSVPTLSPLLESVMPRVIHVLIWAWSSALCLFPSPWIMSAS